MSVESSNINPLDQSNNNLPPVDATKRDVSGLSNQIGTAVRTSKNLTELKKRAEIEKTILGMSLESRIDNYAVFLPESSDTRPILHFFKTLFLKIRQLIGLSPGMNEKIEIEYQLLGSVLRASPDSADCPRSVALDYLIKFYENRKEITNDPEMTAYINQLKFCLSVTRELERLQETAELRGENRAFESIVSLVQNKIISMSTNEKILIPAGWFISETDQKDGLIEIVKTSNNDYDIRFISLEPDLKSSFIGQKDEATGKEKFVPYADFKGVGLTELKAAISPLLQVQLPQLHSKPMSKDSWMNKNVKAVEKLLAGDSKTEARKSIDPLGIMHKVFGKEPVYPKIAEKPILTNFNAESTNMRTLLVYLKTQTSEQNYKDIKLQLEVRTFMDTVLPSRHLLEHSTKLRREAYDAGRRLIYRFDKELQKIWKRLEDLGPTDSEEKLLLARRRVLEGYEDQVLGIMLQIEKYEGGHKKGHSLNEWKVAAVRSDLKLANPVDPDSFKTTTVESRSSSKVAIPTEHNVNFSRNAQGNYDYDRFKSDLDNAVTEAQRLYNEGDYKQLRILVDRTIRSLPVPISDNEFWNGLKSDWKKMMPIEDKIFALSQFLFDAQRMENPNGVASDAVVSLAKLQVIGDFLAHSKPQFWAKKHYIDPSPFLEILANDPYFRNTDAQLHKDAESIRNYWKEPEQTQRKPVCMDNYDDFIDAAIDFSENKVMKNSAGFTDYFFVRECVGADWNECLAFFAGSHVDHNKDPSFEHQRQMRIFSKCMMTQNKHFDLRNDAEKVRAGISVAQSEGTGALTQRQLAQKLYKAGGLPITAYLMAPNKIVNGIRTPTQFKFHLKEHKFLLGDHLVYGDHEYKEWLKWHDSGLFFREDGRPITDEVQQEVVLFALGETNQTDRSQLTQQAVMKDQTPEDIKGLRTAQSGESRFEQSMSVFMKHPEYFKNSSYYRVFELNFFKQGALLSRIRNQPYYIRKIADFFADQYKMANAKGDVKSALIFLKLQIQLRDFIEIEDPGSALLQAFPDKSKILQLFAELEIKATTDLERKNVLGSKLFYRATLNNRVSISDPNDIMEIAKDFLHFKRLPAFHESDDPLLERTIQKLVETISTKIPEARVKELFSSLGVEAQVTATPQKVQTGQWVAGEYKIDLIKGMLIHKGIAASFLPKNEQISQALIGIQGLEKEVPCKMYFYQNHETGTPVTIYIPNINPKIRIISEPGKPYTVQRKMVQPHSLLRREAWYELLDTETASENQWKAPKMAGTLFDKKKIWIKVTDPSEILIGSPQTGMPEYTAKISKQGEQQAVSDIIRLSDGMQLLDPWTTSTEVLGQLGAIEAKEHTLVWGKGNVPAEISYPRLVMGDGSPLTYIVQYDSSKVPFLKPKQFEGYSLKLQQLLITHEENAPSQNPFSPSTGEREFMGRREFQTHIIPTTFDQYHYIAKKDGNAKILIVAQELSSSNPERAQTSGSGFNKWFNRAWFSRSKDDLSAQKVYTFDVDTNRRVLKAQNREANAMMAYVFFAHKNYQAALQYLEFSRTNLQISSKQKQIHAWIQKWPDINPEAIAFKLKALLMENQNREKTGFSNRTIPQELEEVEYLQSLMREYDKNKGELHDAFLLTSEELSLFDTLTQRSYLHILEKKPKVGTTDTAPKSLGPLVVLPSSDEVEQVEFSASQLWSQVGPNPNGLASGASEFSLVGDKFLVQGFESLYKEIYDIDPASQKFQELKRKVFLASPSASLAIALRKYVLSLIDAKEKNENIEEFKFPEEWKYASFMDRFEATRIAGLKSDTSPHRKLIEVFLKLNDRLPKAPQAKQNVEFKPNVDLKDRSVDQAKARADFFKIVEAGVSSSHIIPSYNRNIERLDRLKEAKRETEDQEQMIDAMQKLERTGKLQRILLDRREQKLEIQRSENDEKLKASAPQAPVPQPMLPPQQPLSRSLFTFAGSALFNLFKIEEGIAQPNSDLLPLKRIAESVGVTSSTKRVLNEMVEDTVNFKNNDADSTVLRFTNEESLAVIKETAAMELEELRNGSIVWKGNDKTIVIEENLFFALAKGQTREVMAQLKSNKAGILDRLMNIRPITAEKLRVELGIVVKDEDFPKIWDYIRAYKDLARVEVEGLKSIESRLHNTLFKGQLTGAKGQLKPHYIRVPERLIGLYTDGKITVETMRENFGVKIKEEDIPNLIQSVESYMVLFVKDIALTNLIDALNKLPKDFKDITKEQVVEIQQLINVRRHFSLDSKFSKELLTIEFINGYTMRAEQVSTIIALLEGKNQVRQLGMGAGKSSVLLPTILKKYADGYHLSIGVIPEWLWEIVSNDLDYSSRALFNQRLYRFTFDRNTDISREWLLTQYNQLSSAILNKEAVITTKTFLLSFRDKYIEMLKELNDASPDKKEEIAEKLELMGDILLLIKNRSKVIADEVDSILTIRHELNYAVGAPVKLDPQKFKLGTRIYAKILEWKTRQGVNEDCRNFALKFVNNQQAGVSPETRKKVLHKLAQEFFKELSAKQGLSGVSEDDFVKYVMLDPTVNLKLGEQAIPEFMKALKQTNCALFNDIAYLRQFIGQTLLSTLALSNNANYGRGLDGISTVPYKASNTPVEAEFGDGTERIAYYIQDYLQVGLTQEQTDAFVESLQASITQEMKDVQIETGALGDVKHTPTYLKFVKIYPHIDLIKAFKDPAERIQLRTSINSFEALQDAPVPLLLFLEEWVFPTIEMPNKQVSSNALDLVQMVGEFNGFTGTTWNTDTYDSKVQVGQAKNPGTDGKSIDFLLQAASQKTESGQPVLQIRTVAIDAQDPLKSLVDSIPDFYIRYDALIDAGAYLKGIGNEDVAKGLSSHPHAQESRKRAVVFVDASNNKVVQDFGSDTTSPLSDRKDIQMDERISYYDQGHVIGTDIPHSTKAHAALTIGEDLYVKDLFQAMWRMRKLRKGQQIDFILTTDVEKLILEARRKVNPSRSGPITVEDIIYFCVDNQAKREAEDNARAEKQKIGGYVPQTMFWQIVGLQSGNAEEKKLAQALYKIYENYLFKNTGDNMDQFAAVGREEFAITVLTAQKESSSKEGVLLDQVRSQGSDAVAEKLQEAIAATATHPLPDKSKLPDKLATVSKDSKDSQVQTQRQQQQQMSMQTVPKKSTPDLADVWTSWGALNFSDLWSAMGHWNKVSPISADFDKRIMVSPNFLPGIKENDANYRNRLFGAERNIVKQLVVMRNKQTNEWRAGMVDVLDYEKVVMKLFNYTSDNFEVVAFDAIAPGESIVLLSTAQGSNLPAGWGQNEELRKLLVQVKLINGEVDFDSKNERIALEKWLAGANKPVIRQLVENDIVPNSLEYKSSYLRKALS